MTEELKAFFDQHSFTAATDTILMPMEATQLAIAAGVAAEKQTIVFVDQKWFKSTDLMCKYLNLASDFDCSDLDLPKYLCAADSRPTSFVFAIAQLAVQEMLVAAKSVCDQYPQVDLKMIIFTS